MDVQLATRIDAKVKKTVEAACLKLGVKLRYFIESALLDKLEEVIDAKEIEKLRKEPKRSFEDVVKDLQKHGKL